MIRHFVIVVNFIITNFWTHIRALSVDLDVLQLKSRIIQKASSYKKHFGLAVVLIGVTRFYGTFGMEFEAKERIDWHELSNSPYTFIHQLYPRSTWKQVEIILWCFEVGTYLSWACLAIIPSIGEANRVYPEISGHANRFSKQELSEMLKFRRILSRITYPIELAIITFALVFLYGCLFWNNMYRVNLAAVLFWPLISPYIAYFLHFALGIPLFIMLASGYISIRQKSVLAELTNLNRKLIRLQSDANPEPFHRSHYELWRRFIGLNIRLTRILADLKEYSRFWMSYLTILFSTYILLLCYYAHTILFTQIEFEHFKYMFIAVSVDLVAYDLLLIGQFARVVKLNQRITRQSGVFRLWYQNRPGGKRILNRYLVKAELFQDSRLLRPYAFQLFGNYRITNKSFYAMISYVSVFFLYITKRNN